jgi:hypothetical protein
MSLLGLVEDKDIKLFAESRRLEDRFERRLLFMTHGETL